MKKYNIFVMLFCAVLFLLSACGIKEEYTFNESNGIYTVNTSSQTINHWEFTYKYEVSGNSYTIIYPDHSYYSAVYDSRQSSDYSFTNSPDYKEKKYEPAGPVIELLRKIYEPEPVPIQNIIFAIIFAAVGLCSIIFPGAVLFLSHGWYFKKAQPSDLAIFLTRLSGGVFLIAAVICILLI